LTTLEQHFEGSKSNTLTTIGRKVCETPTRILLTFPLY